MKIITMTFDALMNNALLETAAVLRGCLQAAFLVLILGATAAALDWLVRWIRRCEVSPGLCELLHRVTLLIAIIDCCLVVAFAAHHAWEARPNAMRSSENAPPAVRPKPPANL